MHAMFLSPGIVIFSGVIAYVIGVFFGPPALAQSTVKANGSTTVAPVISAAAEVLKSKGLRITVDTQGGSSGGLTSVSERFADVGLMSKSLTEEDKRKHPNAELRESVIGYDGLAIVVSKAVYEGGVTTLSKAQIRAIYEGKVKNWKDVSGPDARIVFFNKEPGRGTWEVFAQFVYGKAELAPKVFHPEVGANQEALTKVSQHKSAVTQLSASWASGARDVRIVGIRREDGTVSLPTREEMEKESYPLRRPLVLLTRGAPRGDVAKLVSFFDTMEGRSIVEKAGFLSKVGALAKAGR